MKALMNIQEVESEVCYLLHFDSKISDKHTTQHYLGTTKDLKKRMRKHENNPDAKLLQVAKAKRIGFTVVKLWAGGREKELALKSQKNGKRFCPICNKTHAVSKILES